MIKNFKYPLKITAALLTTVIASNAHAIAITANTSASDLANSILGTGITITSSTLSGQSTSSGTYTNTSGTYGIGDGIVLSSGNVNDYNDGANNATGNATNFGTSATAAQELLLDPITGGSFDHYDVTQLDLTFDAGASTDSIFFNVVWGSEEYPEYIGSTYIDAFGIYLNGVNIATYLGNAVNVDHPNMAAVTGTELDGILDPAGSGSTMLFEGLVTAGSTGNTLTFIIADSGDNILDSVAYISGLGNVDPGGGQEGGGQKVPEPASLALFGLGLAGLAATRRRKKSLKT